MRFTLSLRSLRRHARLWRKATLPDTRPRRFRSAGGGAGYRNCSQSDLNYYPPQGTTEEQ